MNSKLFFCGTTKLKLSFLGQARQVCLVCACCLLLLVVLCFASNQNTIRECSAKCLRTRERERTRENERERERTRERNDMQGQTTLRQFRPQWHAQPPSEGTAACSLCCQSAPEWRDREKEKKGRRGKEINNCNNCNKQNQHNQPAKHANKQTCTRGVVLGVRARFNHTTRRG